MKMNFMNEWLLAVELIFSLFLNRWKNCFGPFLRYSLTKPYKKYYWPLTQFFRCFLLIITIFFAIKFDWVWNILRDRHLQTKEKILLTVETIFAILSDRGKIVNNRWKIFIVQGFWWSIQLLPFWNHFLLCPTTIFCKIHPHNFV